MCIAYRVIPDKVYKDWIKKYHEASISLQDREKKLEEVYNKIEQELIVIGSTAIEYKLSDKVPETINTLLKVKKKFKKLYIYLFLITGWYKSLGFDW